MHLTLTWLLVFFAVSFQLWSKAIYIKFGGNFSSQLRDLAFIKFLSRLGYDYYVYIENFRYAKSQVSNTELIFFFFVWRAYTYC